MIAVLLLLCLLLLLVELALDLLQLLLQCLNLRVDVRLFFDQRLQIDAVHLCEPGMTDAGSRANASA